MSYWCSDINWNNEYNVIKYNRIQDNRMWYDAIWLANKSQQPWRILQLPSHSGCVRVQNNNDQLSWHPLRPLRCSKPTGMLYMPYWTELACPVLTCRANSDPTQSHTKQTSEDSDRNIHKQTETEIHNDEFVPMINGNYRNTSDGRKTNR